MKEFKLFPPVKHIRITQPFGVNYVYFYQDLGLKAHNGVDLDIMNGCPIRAMHDGIVHTTEKDGYGGLYLELITEDGIKSRGYKTIYGHLKRFIASKGMEVKAGDIIAEGDNTGLSTGSHLHAGVKEVWIGKTLNHDNGYFGALDPELFLVKGWDDRPAKLRYGLPRTWQSYQQEIKIMGYLTKILKRLPTWEMINACVYGYWDKDAILNPAMEYNWAYLTKPGFLKGERPFSI